MKKKFLYCWGLILVLAAIADVTGNQPLGSFVSLVFTLVFLSPFILVFWMLLISFLNLLLPDQY